MALTLPPPPILQRAWILSGYLTDVLAQDAMVYRFGPFELDALRFELRQNEVVVAVEPQVLSLLLFLVANRHRLVTKDEIVTAIWHGRIMSDSAISSRVKSARRIVGDDGRAQRLIRTSYGRGFRFVGDVDEVQPHWAATPNENDEPLTEPTRPSIAVIPLSMIGDPGALGILAEALPHEIIQALSRLRWLFVIARASSFRFASPAHDLRRIGEVLGVRYVLSGTLEAFGERVVVAVELAKASDGGIVWAERFNVRVGAVHDIRTEIVSSVVAALEVQIPRHEADRMRLASPEHIDAWSAYHLGLQRMFRFTALDNAAAAEFFEQALAKDHGFARAHAGLSFTRFQDAFLGYKDRASATAAACQAAERAVTLDSHDPFANLAMGRAQWLSGDLEDSVAWLNRSTDLSPNYAQGIYAQAWAQALLSRGDGGQSNTDRAMALSPLDPLRYAMLATRALSHLVRDDAASAVPWAERAVREPGAHVLIDIIAAACSAAVGDIARARERIAVARKRQPSITRDKFFRSFPFSEAEVRSRMGALLSQSGLS